MVAEVGEVAVVVVAGTVAVAAVVVTLLPTRLLLETTDAGRRVAFYVLCIPSRRKDSTIGRFIRKIWRFAGLFRSMID